MINVFGFLWVLSLFTGFSDLRAHSHSHTNVYVNTGGNHHWHERVYESHPWYHRDHVYIHEGYYYPNYYAGAPYYYYDPSYYYYENAPAVSLRVNIP